jgi:hypothetical protein
MKKKLSKKDLEKLWGEDGPYSEVSTIEQTRVLDNRISRVFLVTEAKINPFTFEYVLKHRDFFKNNEPIQQLLDNAEYQGPALGYVVSAGEEELIDKRSFEVVSEYKKILLHSVMLMHDFVMKELGIEDRDDGVMLDRGDSSAKYVWNENEARTVKTDGSVWGSETVIGSPLGAKDGKIRYYVILVLDSGKLSMNKEEVVLSAKKIKETAKKFNVEIEGVSAGRGWLIFSVFISPDTVPAEFIEMSIIESNKDKKIFRREYFVTNVSRPTNMEILSFIKRIK